MVSRGRTLFVTNIFAGEKLLVEAEITQVFDAHRVKDAEKVIDFVLHHAGVKVLDATIDCAPELIDAAIAQPLVSRHETAHARHGKTAFPALLELHAQRL